MTWVKQVESTVSQNGALGLGGHSGIPLKRPVAFAAGRWLY